MIRIILNLPSIEKGHLSCLQTRIYSVSGGSLLRKLKPLRVPVGSIRKLQLSFDEKIALAQYYDNGEDRAGLFLFDLTNDEVRAIANHGVQSFAFSHQSKKIAVGFSNGNIIIFDAESLLAEQTLSGHEHA